MISSSSVKNEEAWYAEYPMLNRALTLLKPLPDDVQELVGKQLYTHAKELAFAEYEALPTDEDSSVVGLKRLRQFMQNKSHHSLVSRALNEVMGLNEQGRALVGQRLLLCLQALDHLNRRHSEDDLPTSTAQNRIEVHTLIKLVFNEELSHFEMQGRQLKEKRKVLLAEEKLAEEMLAQALEEVGVIEEPYSPNHANIQDEVLQWVELDPEMARLAALQECVPHTLNPTMKRIGRFLVLHLTTPEEVDVLESQEEKSDMLVESLEEDSSEDIFESSQPPTTKISHSEESNIEGIETSMKKSFSLEPTLESPKKKPESLGPFELSEVERHALIEEVVNPIRTDVADQKVNDILSLIDSGIDVETIPADATPEEKLARGLALFNASDPPLIKPNKRDLALTEAEIDALIARVVEAPEVRSAKEQAKQKIIEALEFMNDLVKPSIGVEAKSCEETLAKAEEKLKTPRKAGSKKTEATEKKSKDLNKSTAEAKPKSTSKSTSKTTTPRKKATDTPKG